MSEANVRVSMRADNGLGCSFAVVDKGSAAVLILLRDFYKLIGKMCAKPADSKYFGTRMNEGNRMVVCPDGKEHMLRPDEAPAFAARVAEFLSFAEHIRRTV